MWLEMCGSCGKEYGEYEIKDGSLCRHCFGRLLESVKKRCKDFTKRELRCLTDQLAEPDIWGQIGALGIGSNMIAIGGKGIRLKNVKRISLNFHPSQVCRRQGTVMGAVTVIVELRHPHIVLEEPLSREYMTVSYHISGKKITYKYSRWLEALVRMLQECLEKRICDMTPYREKVCSLVREYNREKAEEEKRAGEEARKRTEEARKRAEDARRRTEEARRRAGDARRWTEEAEKRAEEARRQAENAGKKAHDEQKSKTNKKRGDEALQKARSLFQVENIYTKNELKERRRRLLKKYHPDVGGSEEMAKKINMAYDLLAGYAAS